MLSLARGLIMIGVLLVIAGGVLYAWVKFDLPLGSLPGDFHIEIGGFTCFFPLATMILVSVFLTLALNILVRWLGRH